MKTEVETARSKMGLANSELEKAEQRIAEMRQKIYDFRRKHEDCLKEHSLESPLCVEFKEAWDNAKNEIASFREGTYHDLEYAAGNAKEEFEILSARYKVKYNQYIDAIAP